MTTIPEGHTPTAALPALVAEKRPGTKPVFTLIGLFGGLLLAFWGGYFLLMEAIGRGRGSRAGKADE
jgi:hypothetical protein